MHQKTEVAFIRLLDSWNEHQELRAQHAEITELFASRSRLDDARLEARKAA